jgi:hypothetical protein
MKMTQVLLLSLLVLIMVSADSSAESGAKLTARISAKITKVKSIDNLQVTVVISNDGSANGAFNVCGINSPITALEVRNALGEPMSPVPPSIPRPPKYPGEYDHVLKPGETYLVNYTLRMFDSELPDGHYTVHLREPRSNDLAFVIEAPKPPYTLHAHLTALSTTVTSINDLKLKAVLTNNGPADATLDLSVLHNPRMALGVYSEYTPLSSGRLLPPESAPLKAKPCLLKAHDHLVLQYDLRDMFERNAYIPEGKYIVRMLDLDSNNLEVTLNSAHNNHCRR